MNESLHLAKGFKMFLSDQETFNNFDIDGAVFQTYVNKPGLQYFEVKMKIKKNLQDDPKVLCKIYNGSKSYAEVKQFHKTSINFRLFCSSASIQNI